MIDCASGIVAQTPPNMVKDNLVNGVFVSFSGDFEICGEKENMTLGCEPRARDQQHGR
jgi:hypothetical protein